MERKLRVKPEFRRIHMWRNQLNRILNIIMGSAVGVFIGYGLYAFWEYKKYPELYAMQSAPWYINILVYGIFAVAVLILGIVLKLAIRKSMGK